MNITDSETCQRTENGNNSLSHGKSVSAPPSENHGRPPVKPGRTVERSLQKEVVSNGNPVVPTQQDVHSKRQVSHGTFLSQRNVYITYQRTQRRRYVESKTGIAYTRGIQVRSPRRCKSTKKSPAVEYSRYIPLRSSCFESPDWSFQCKILFENPPVEHGPILRPRALKLGGMKAVVQTLVEVRYVKL